MPLCRIGAAVSTDSILVRTISRRPNIFVDEPTGALPRSSRIGSRRLMHYASYSSQAMARRSCTATAPCIALAEIVKAEPFDDGGLAGSEPRCVPVRVGDVATVLTPEERSG